MPFRRDAGSILRERRGEKKRALEPEVSSDTVTPNLFGGIGDFFGDIIGSIGGAIGSIVNAVTKAGKSLVSVIGDVVNWTVDQIADLVESLIEAGKTVSEILGAAVQKGTVALKKFVQAVIKAGRAAAEVLAFAVTQAAVAINDILRALRDMLQALHAQMGEGYDYGGTPGLQNAGGDFTKFNREQQASIIQDYFRIRFGCSLM